jgi:hypothetical protein
VVSPLYYFTMTALNKRKTANSLSTAEPAVMQPE